ncbi:unnamed protein product [Darwinula stevensoni]|uniref:Protein MCM10 homolog n=1 Tax=Darwinula stevensoni TaxID=69355 RepID=A0A7R9AEW4_9CRUS|nr:unnamed protein product [Darwinula stevensoni]CAG0902298.1 unnamed protein product [Darwinula stevensoni]
MDPQKDAILDELLKEFHGSDGDDDCDNKGDGVVQIVKPVSGKDLQKQTLSAADIDSDEEAALEIIESNSENEDMPKETGNSLDKGRREGVNESGGDTDALDTLVGLLDEDEFSKDDMMQGGMRNSLDPLPDKRCPSTKKSSTGRCGKTELSELNFKGEQGSSHAPDEDPDEELNQELKELQRKMEEIQRKLQNRKGQETDDQKNNLSKSGSNTPDEVRMASSRTTEVLDSLPDASNSKAVKRVIPAEESKRLLEKLSQKKVLKREEEPRLPTKEELGFLDSSDEEEERCPLESRYNAFGKDVKKRIAHQAAEKKSREIDKQMAVLERTKRVIVHNETKQVKSGNSKILVSGSDSGFLEQFSGIRVTNPIISSVDLQGRMYGKHLVRLGLIKGHIIKGSSIDIEGDWVTIGVLISKSDSKQLISEAWPLPCDFGFQGNPYRIWNLNDLHDCTQMVSLFLFGKAHKNLWKTSVGTVVGLLNPSIMESHANDNNQNVVATLSINDENRALLIGTSKDLGICRARKTNGTPCTMPVNKSQCEFCTYHLQTQYKKSALKRSELQSTFSGVEPKHRKRPNNQASGNAQIYCTGSIQSPPRERARGKFNLGSLKMKQEAQKILNMEKEKAGRLKHLNESEFKALSKAKEGLADMLVVPNAGSRNLLRHLSQEFEPTALSGLTAKEKSLTPRELLNKHSEKLKDTLKPAMPQLGRGLLPGQLVDLDIYKISSPDAKRRAIQLVKKKGTLGKVNPNSIRKSPTDEQKAKVIQKVNEDLGPDSNSKPAEVYMSQLMPGKQMSAEDLKAIMSARSRHTDLVSAAEAQAAEKYFDDLEKKENVEQKMLEIWEVPTTVVVCSKCNYRAFTQSDLCRAQGHAIKRMKANKRWFKCKKCGKRTIAFDRIPSKPCKQCAESSWERCPMGKERQGPKLESEILSIRGTEQKFIGGFNAGELNINI